MQDFGEMNVRRNFTSMHEAIDRAAFRTGMYRYPRAAARERLGVALDEIIVLTTGTVCALNGQIDAIEAVRSFEDKTAERIKWFIVGHWDREYSDKLRRRHAELRPERARNVFVVPDIAEAHLYYSAADIFVCTSRIESFPRAILEAMAAGLPILTTAVPGIHEEVREGCNAIIYNLGDSHDLAQKVAAVARDRSLRERMSRESSSVLGTLVDYDQYIDRYARIFREAWLSGFPQSDRHGSDVLSGQCMIGTVAG